MLEIMGLIGGLCFTYSGIPLALECHKTGNTGYLNVQTIWSVFLGAVLMFTYIVLKLGFDWFVFLDYGITILTWAIILRYYYFPKKT